MEAPKHANIWAALAAAQAEYKPLKQSGRNPHFKSEYSTLGDIIDATRPALTKHGIAIYQAPGTLEGGDLVVKSLLAHGDSGDVLEDDLIIARPAKMQDLGNVVTYARRYLLGAQLGIAAGEDDDGNTDAATPPQQRAAPPRRQNPASPAAAKQALSTAHIKVENSEPLNPDEWDAVIDAAVEGSEPDDETDNPFDGEQEPKPVVPDKLRKQFHALGREVYGDGWDGLDGKRAELVMAITTGAASSSGDLTAEEMERLIVGMKKARAKQDAQNAIAKPTGIQWQQAGPDVGDGDNMYVGT